MCGRERHRQIIPATGAGNNNKHSRRKRRAGIIDGIMNGIGGIVGGIFGKPLEVEPHIVGGLEILPVRFLHFKSLTHRQFRGIESRVLKICDFKKVIFSPFFKHNITGFGVLIPKRYHMLG